MSRGIKDIKKDAVDVRIISATHKKLEAQVESGEFRQDAVLALVAAMLAVALYIWIRFEWQFGVTGLFALAHDVFATLLFLYPKNSSRSVINANLL